MLGGRSKPDHKERKRERKEETFLRRVLITNIASQKKRKNTIKKTREN